MTYIRFFFILYWFTPFLKFGPLPTEIPRCAPVYDQYFKVNLNNLKSTWKGIMSLIANKHSNINLPTHNNSAAVTDPLYIANIFNYYFRSIAEKTKANINCFDKSFQDFLHYPKAAFTLIYTLIVYILLANKIIYNK